MSFSLLKCLSVLQVPEYAVIEKTLDKDDDGVTASSHIIYSFTKLLLFFFFYSRVRYACVSYQRSRAMMTKEEEEEGEWRCVLFPMLLRWTSAS